MAANSKTLIPPPPGFELDAPAASAVVPTPPEGFELDQPTPGGPPVGRWQMAQAWLDDEPEFTAPPMPIAQQTEQIFGLAAQHGVSLPDAERLFLAQADRDRQQQAFKLEKTLIAEAKQAAEAARQKAQENRPFSHWAEPFPMSNLNRQAFQRMYPHHISVVQDAGLDTALAHVYQSAQPKEAKDAAAREVMADYVAERAAQAQKLVQAPYSIRAQIEAAHELRNQLGGKTTRRWDRGAAVLASGGYHVLEEIQRATTAGAYGDSAAEQSRMYYDLLNSPSFQPVVDNWFDKYIGGTVESGPFMIATLAPAMLTGGAATPSLISGFIVSYGIEGNMTYQAALDRGEPEPLARARGRIVGIVNGMIEVGGGSGAKYYANRIARNAMTRLQRAGNFTIHGVKTALREGLVEEVPQEISTMVLGGDVDRAADGTVDWDRTVDRLIDVAAIGTIAGGVMDAGVTVLNVTQESVSDAMDRQERKLSQQPQVIEREFEDEEAAQAFADQAFAITKEKGWDAKIDVSGTRVRAELGPKGSLAAKEQKAKAAEAETVGEIATRTTADLPIAEQEAQRGAEPEATEAALGTGAIANIVYHGTSAPIEKIGKPGEAIYTTGNIYGQGFYTTDKQEIAAKYTNKGKGKQPTVYRVTLSPDIESKLYDMESPLTPEDRAEFGKVIDEGWGDEFGGIVNEPEIKNLRQLYDAIRDESGQALIPADDVQELFDSIARDLQEQGYRGLRHKGGLIIGKIPHTVRIFWNPKEDVSLEVIPKEVARGSETQPAIPAEGGAAVAERAAAAEAVEPTAPGERAVPEAVTAGPAEEVVAARPEQAVAEARALQLSVPDAVAKAFNAGYDGPNAKNPHIASSPLADAFALGQYAKTNNLTGRVRKSRGYTWVVGENTYRVDSGKVTPTTTAEGITGEPAPTVAESARVEGEWKIAGRKGEMANQWQKADATIVIETRKKTKSGTGGKRYVARVGNEEYGALTLADAQRWADVRIEQPAPTAANEPGAKATDVSGPISKEENNALRDIGFSVSDILKMDPAKAREIITLHKKAGPGAKGFAGFLFKKEMTTEEKIKEALDQLRAMMAAAEAAQPIAPKVEEAKMETPSETPKEPGSVPGITGLLPIGERGHVVQTADSLYQKVFNRFHAIEDIANRAIASGAKIQPGENPKFLSRAYLGIANSVHTALAKNTFKIKADGDHEVTGESYQSIVDEFDDRLQGIEPDVDVRLQDLDDHANAIRTIYDLRRKPYPGAEREIVTPEQVTEAEATIERLKEKYGKNYAILEDTNIRRTDFRNRILHLLVDAGNMSQERYDVIRAENPHYTPFDRVLEEVEPQTGVPGKPLFTKTRAPIHRIKGSELDVANTMESDIKNTYRIMNAAMRNRVATGVFKLISMFPDEIAPASAKVVPIQVTAEELSRLTGAEQTEGGTIFRPSRYGPHGAVVECYVDGKKTYMEVSPPLYDAMTGLNEAGLHLLAKILGAPAHTLRVGATITPEFMLKNPTRDQWTALLNSQVGFMPFVDAVRGAASILKKDAAVDAWHMAGGSYAGFVELSRPALAKAAHQLRGTTPPSWAHKLNIIAHAQTASQFFEQATRVGMYRAAKRAGMSDIEAAFVSREGTVDFARRGSVMKETNAVFPFFNAGLQSVDRMARAVRANPIGYTIKGLATITLPSLLLYALNRDDDEYKEIPRWQRDLFWCIHLGGIWLRIPKPFGPGQVFGSMVERFAEYLDTQDRAAFDEFSRSLVDAFSPISGDPIGGLLPAAIRPLIENETNWNFFLERNIVPENRTDLTASEQYGRYTSETAKVVGSWINYSPAKLENLVQGYFGGTGRYGLQASDLLVNGMRQLAGEEVPGQRPREWADIPLIKGFVIRDPMGSQAQSLQDFYGQSEDVQKYYATWRAHLSAGNEAKARALLADHPELILNSAMTKERKALSEFASNIDQIVANKGLSDDEKRRHIQEQNAERMNSVWSANAGLKAKSEDPGLLGSDMLRYAAMHTYAESGRKSDGIYHRAGTAMVGDEIAVELVSERYEALAGRSLTTAAIRAEQREIAKEAKARKQR